MGPGDTVLGKVSCKACLLECAFLIIHTVIGINTADETALKGIPVLAQTSEKHYIHGYSRVLHPCRCFHIPAPEQSTREIKRYSHRRQESCQSIDIALAVFEQGCLLLGSKRASADGKVPHPGFLIGRDGGKSVPGKRPEQSITTGRRQAIAQDSELGI